MAPGGCPNWQTEKKGNKEKPSQNKSKGSHPVTKKRLGRYQRSLLQVKKLSTRLCLINSHDVLFLSTDGKHANLEPSTNSAISPT